MDDAEFVGGVLLDCRDPRSGAVALAEILCSADVDVNRVRELGLDVELVQVLRRRLPRDLPRIERACAEGAAWVLGRRSSVGGAFWELVVSLPPGTPLPPQVKRSTGETMLALVSNAQLTLRIAAPFVDAVALDFLADAIVAAACRGTHVDLYLPMRLHRGAGVMARLLAHAESQEVGRRLRIARFRADAPWAHLKVIAVDSRAAYVGSANITGAALSGPNLELGVLVLGSAVQAIEELLDSYRDG